MTIVTVQFLSFLHQSKYPRGKLARSCGARRVNVDINAQSRVDTAEVTTSKSNNKKLVLSAEIISYR
jgi:hypothetical protein